MADAPKEKKEGLTLFEQTILLLIVIYAALVFWYRLEDFLVYYHGGSYDSLWGSFVAYWFSHLLPIIRIVATIVTAFCLWGIVHATGKLRVIEKEEREIYGEKTGVTETVDATLKNERWERVVTHLNSTNAADWRLAVIEADIMLDELLKAQGYHGDSLGERLKAVEKSDMLTLDNAWEAHRVRNQVAHQGADFPLSEREAKRAITLYESVFKEFKII